MSRSQLRLVPPGFTLGLLAVVLAACSDDSLPTQPAFPASAAPVDAPTADYVADSWATKQSLPTARRGLVTASVNGLVYAIGGRSSNEVNLSTVEVYDPNGPVLNHWKSRAPLPSPRAWPSGVAVINGKIYVPGGLNANASPTKTLFMYRPATNTWVKKAAMPIASYGGAAVAIGGKLYVLTPAGGATHLHRYDPSSNSWTPRASGPMGHYYPVAGVIDGKIYVAGTMGAGESPSYVVSVYDPSTNTWSTRAAMQEDQIGAAGQVIGGKLYVAGGFEDLNQGPRFILRVYNPATNSWVEKASMAGERGFASAAAVNGVLHVIGGLQPPNVLQTHQVYYP
jgi:N-acetylneuraminic acid mutarotase